MARKRVINITTETRKLSRNENGSIVVLDRAAGSTVTLPAAGRGLSFQFVVKASGNYVIDGGTDKMRGVALLGITNVGTCSFIANAASTVKIETDGAAASGSTKGGEVGSNFQLVCDTDGIWTVKGILVSTTGATAALATPFSA